MVTCLSPVNLVESPELFASNCTLASGGFSFCPALWSVLSALASTEINNDNDRPSEAAMECRTRLMTTLRLP